MVGLQCIQQITSFGTGGIAAEAQPKGLANPVCIVGAIKLNDAESEPLGNFEKRRVVEERQGLERRVRANASTAGTECVRAIENGQGRMGGRPKEKGVKASAKSIFPGIGLPSSLDLTKAHHAFWLRGVHAGTSHLVRQQSRCGEGDISNDF